MATTFQAARSARLILAHQSMRIYDRTLEAGEVATLVTRTDRATPSEVKETRPMARFPLNEGAGKQVTDLLSKQNGTVTGKATWAKDVTGAYVSLDGASGVDLGDRFNFDRVSKFSGGGWVRVKNGASASVLSRMEGSTRFRGWDLFVEGGRVLAHLVSDWGRRDAIRVVSRDVVVPLGEWHHLFLTYDGTGKGAGVRLYVDGMSIPVNVDVDKLQGTLRNTGTAMLGSRTPHRAGQYAFQGLNGDLQGISIYSQALDAGEVMRLAQVPQLPAAPLPAGLQANYALDKVYGAKTSETMGGWGEATLEGTPTTVSGRFGNALQFDGKSGLRMPRGTEVDTRTPFSAACWVKPAGVRRGALLSTQASGADKEGGWEIWTEGGVVYVELVRVYPTDWLMVRSQGEPLAAGKWRHVAFTYDGSGKAAGVRLFIDGAPIATVPTDDKLTGSIKTASPLCVANRDKGFFFTGMMDEVSLFNRVLPPEEMARLAATSWTGLVLATPAEGRSPAQQALYARLSSERANSAALLSALKRREDLDQEIAGQGGELALVRYSPDGRLMLVAGKLGEARIVEVRSGKEIAALPTVATLAAFSPDGRVVVTSDGKMTRLWSARDGKPLAWIPTGKGAVQALSFQAHGRELAAAVVDRDNTTLVFWDLTAKRVSRRLSLPATEASAMQFGPKGKNLALGTLTGQIRLWSLPELRERESLRGHRGAVLTLAFAPDGVTLASGSRDTTVRFWNLLAAREVAALRGDHEEAVTYAAFTRDGLSLMTSSADAPVRIWRAPDTRKRDAEASQFVAAIGDPPPSGPMRVTAVSTDSQISLKWKPVPGVTAYEVRRATTPDGTFVPVGRTEKPLYHDRQVTPGQRYLYSVAGVSTRPGIASASVAVLCAGTPSAPTGFTVEPLGSAVVLSWAEVSGATSYQVSRADRREGPYTVLARDVPFPYYEDGSISRGSYFYRVAAANRAEVGPTTEPLLVNPPWAVRDVGGAKPGGVTFSADQIKVSGFGKRLGQGAADEVRFVYQPVSGDVEIVAKVDPAPGAGAASSSGLMIRASEYGEDRFVFLGLDSGGVSVYARPSFYQQATSIRKSTLPGDVRWLKLVRRGRQITALASQNGTAWLVVGWTTMDSGNDMGGLAVSGSATQEGSATFEQVRVGSPAEGTPLSADTRLPVPTGENLLKVTPANLTNYEGQTARATEDPEGLLISGIKRSIDGQNHFVHLVQRAPLIPGRVYTLQFRARADRTRVIRVGLQDAQNPYGSQGFEDSVPLDTEWRTFRFVFTANIKNVDLGSQFYVHLAQEAGSVRLGDFTLVGERTAPTVTASKSDVPVLTALPASMEPILRSVGGNPCVITFANRSDRPVELIWLDYQGQRKSYAVIRPGQTYDQTTATSQPWLVVREGGGPLAIYVSQTATGLVEITQAMVAADLYPKRSEAAGKAQLDLTRFYNASLNQQWHSSPGGNGSSLELSPEVRSVNGIAFDVRGIVSLTGTHLETALPGAFPRRVTGIPVGMPVRGLHFLHSTGWSAPQDAEVGRYTFHYVDGTTVTLPIIYGKDVYDWVTGEGGPVEALRGGSGRLHLTRWTNPKPDVAVASFDYESTMTASAPFLVAVTADLPTATVRLVEGGYFLGAQDATPHGTLHLETPQGIPNVGFWDSAADYLSWTVELKTPGAYRVVASIATPNTGARLTAEVGGGTTHGDVPNTGGWQEYVEVDLGTLTTTQAGAQTFSLRPSDGVLWKAINLRWVRLVPR